MQIKSVVSALINLIDSPSDRHLNTTTLRTLQTKAMTYVSKSSLILVALTCLLSQLALAGGPPDLSDFQGYKTWLATATYEDKYEHFTSISANFTAKHGEDANSMRLCLALEQDWKGLDNWVDQKWRKVGVRHITTQRYNDWIANARPDDKPWVVALGLFPLNGAKTVQPSDNMMRSLGCLAKVYGDKLNVGFMDFREAELIYEMYTIKLDYGQQTPALLGFKDGKMYPAVTESLGA